MNKPNRLLTIGSLLFASSLCWAEPALVGNAGLKTQALDADGTKALLLGKRITIGETRVVIIIAKTNEAQDTFLQNHVGMTTSQFQNHWRRLFMTGGGTAPKIVENQTEAIQLAAGTPGAVTIIDSNEAKDLTILAK